MAHGCMLFCWFWYLKRMYLNTGVRSRATKGGTKPPAARQTPIAVTVITNCQDDRRDDAGPNTAMYPGCLGHKESMTRAKVLSKFTRTHAHGENEVKSIRP